MDTTKENIKMCKAAQKIQALWEPNIGDYHTWNNSLATIGMMQFENITGCELRDKTIWGNKKQYGQYIVGEYHEWVIMSFRFPPRYSPQTIINLFQDTYKTDDKCIWLPKQDQLQNMVEGEYWQLQYDMYHFMQTPYVDNQNAAEVFTSMEQLWLAFVMDDKFNKKWDESEWN